MDLKKLSSDDLAKELARRQKSADKLIRRREKVASELADLDKELAALGVDAGTARGKNGRGGLASTADRPKRTMPKNEMSLPDAIAAAMEVRAQVTPKEAADLVKQNGYKTNSKTFGVQVASALTKDPRFKRVERGVYERTK